jgi:hypothetical protein
MSLVAHWKLDGDAKDSVGGNNGTINGASITSGKLGDALDFDGNGDGVNVGARRFSASSWSMTMWIKPAEVSKLQHLTGVYGYDFGDWSPLSHFAIKDSKATWWDPDSGWKYGNTTLSNGSWYFICLVGNTDEKSVTTYVNGEKDRKVTSTIKNNIGVLDVIGYRGHSNDRYFNGKIDDVRLYDHAISEKKIQQLSQAKVLHYKFDSHNPEQLNKTNTLDTGSSEPHGIGYDPVNDYIICTDDSPQIARFEANTLSKVDDMSVSWAVNYVIGVAYDSELDVFWMMDWTNKDVVKVDPSDFSEISRYNMPSNPNGSQDSIGFALDDSGRLYGSMRDEYIGRWDKEDGSNAEWMNIESYINTDFEGQGIEWNDGTLYIGNSDYANSGRGDLYTCEWNQSVSQFGTLSLTDDPSGFANADGTLHVSSRDDTRQERYYIGGNVTDASGYENTGTLNGPAFTESSKVGSGAYNFSDSNGIKIPNNPTVQLTGDLTVSFWAKPFAISSDRQNPINKSYAEEFTMTAETDGGLSFYCNDSDSYYNNYYASDMFQNDNEWVHVTAVRDVGNEVVWYRNGEHWQTKSWDGGDPIAGSDDLIIGDGYTNPYNGILDDVRLYATALSASEVQEVYEQRASIDTGGNFHSHEVEEPDERTIFTDSTYSVNSQTYNVLTTTTPEDTDYSEWVESDDTLGNIYLEGWVYLTNSSWYPTTFEFTKDNNDKGVYTDFQDGVDSWQQGWNYVFVKADNWDNVSNTPWGNMDRLQLYRSGADSGDSSESIRFKNIRLKKYPDNEPVDDMSLQDGGTLRSNSISEVGPGAESLVGWWPLDGDTRDYAGSANGTNNGASVTSGLGQSAYYFDGDSITIPHSNRLDISGKEITVSLWKTGEDRGDTFHTLLDKENGSTGYIIEHGWGTDNYSSVGSFSFSNDYPNPFGWDWEHVVLRLKEEVVETFVDGISKNSDTYTGNIGSNTDNITIGSGWKGKIQDVRIYNRGLTDQEIETLYNLTDSRQNQQVVQTDNGLVHTKHKYDERL